MPGPTQESRHAAKKEALRRELSWLTANSTLVHTKRARPKMTYSSDDIEAMNREENESSYEYKSSSESSDDTDDD